MVCPAIHTCAAAVVDRCPRTLLDRRQMAESAGRLTTGPRARPDHESRTPGQPIRAFVPSTADRAAEQSPRLPPLPRAALPTVRTRAARPRAPDHRREIQRAPPGCTTAS